MSFPSSPCSRRAAKGRGCTAGDRPVIGSTASATADCRQRCTFMGALISTCAPHGQRDDLFRQRPGVFRAIWEVNEGDDFRMAEALAVASEGLAMGERNARHFGHR